MILRVDVIDAVLKDIRTKDSKVVLLDAGGEKFNQKKAAELAKTKHLILIAGHYEGVDARVHEHLVNEVVSVGDYVLTGGEIPAMVITDAIVRLIPGVLEKKEATELESFSEGALEYPQYTRPEDFKGWKVPEVLLSGNHREIEEWKKEEAAKRTKKVRPDLT
jgi:tRNA (guanine37-N1)-methyltransferase